MPLLDASLAFTLTMLGLASVVTLVIEIIHRVLQLRAKGLQQMLEAFYDREIAPVLEEQVEGFEKTAGKAREDFLQRLLKNPLVMSSAKLQAPLRSVEKLSYEELLTRLKETETGKLVSRLVLDKQQEAGKILDRWGEMYEHYGRASSNYFARRASVLSIIAGVVVAFVGNVHAVRIFDSYLQDPVSAQAVIAQSETFQDGWKQAEGRLDAALDALRQSGGQSGPEEIEAGLRQVAASLQSLGGQGVPLGYDRHPVRWELDQWKFWSWLVTVLLTGFLLGLGGPFWFRIVTRLGQLRGALRGGPSGRAAPPPEAGENLPATQSRVAMLGQPDAT